MVLKILAVIGLGSILGLDGRAVFQGMISHPLVAGTLTGAVMGEPWIGFEVGVIVGMLWVHVLPIGGAIPPNGAVIAIVTSCLGITLGGGHAGLCLALLYSVPFGQLARRLDGALRQLNITASRSVVGAEAADRVRILAMSQLFGIVCVAAEVAICLAVALALGVALLPAVLDQAPMGVRRGLQLAWGLMPLVGAAAVVRTLNRRYAWPVVGGVCLVLLALVTQLRGAP